MKFIDNTLLENKPIEIFLGSKIFEKGIISEIAKK